MPWEKSSGLLTSTTTFSWKAAAPADWITPSVASPLVQRKTSSLSPAASANVPCDALTPFLLAHLPAFGLSGVREPIVTWWPICTNFVPMASPTMPVPRTPIFIIPHYLRKRNRQAGLSADSSHACRPDARRLLMAARKLRRDCGSPLGRHCLDNSPRRIVRPPITCLSSVPRHTRARNVIQRHAQLRRRRLRRRHAAESSARAGAL